MMLKEFHKVALEQKRIAYSINETIAISGQPRSAIYQAIRKGLLVARKRGCRTLILADDLRRWLEDLPRLETRPAA